MANAALNALTEGATGMEETWLTLEKKKADKERRRKLLDEDPFVATITELIPPKTVGIPRLPKNEILGKKECDDCKHFHLFPDSRLVLQFSNHDFLHTMMLFDSTVKQENCPYCIKEGEKHVQCGCPCHRSKPRFTYNSLSEDNEYYYTHWTEHDLASEGKIIFEKLRNRHE